MNSFWFNNHFVCFTWQASLIQKNSAVTPEYVLNIIKKFTHVWWLYLKINIVSPFWIIDVPFIIKCVGKNILCVLKSLCFVLFFRSSANNNYFHKKYKNYKYIWFVQCWVHNGSATIFTVTYQPFVNVVLFVFCSKISTLL
jgi:hypothetical protein